MDVGGDARADLPAPDSWKILGGLRFALAMIVLLGHLGRFVPDEGAINKGLLLFDGLGAVDCRGAVLVPPAVRRSPCHR